MSGSIKANKIKAKNVVKGIQVQGKAPENLEKLQGLANAGGDIEASEIDAESVVSGLQILSGKMPATREAFSEQLATLKALVSRLQHDATGAESPDVEEIAESLAKSEKELGADTPSVARLGRWLKNVNDIASNVKTNVETFTAIATTAKNLAQVVASLFG